jgi:hypothetical protein
MEKTQEMENVFIANSNITSIIREILNAGYGGQHRMLSGKNITSYIKGVCMVLNREILRRGLEWVFMRQSQLSDVLSILRLRKSIALRLKPRLDVLTNQPKTLKAIEEAVEEDEVQARLPWMLKPMPGVLMFGETVYAKDEFDYVYFRKYQGGLWDPVVDIWFPDDVHQYDGDNCYCQEIVDNPKFKEENPWP